jgi:hypothetical protein
MIAKAYRRTFIPSPLRPGEFPEPAATREFVRHLYYESPTSCSAPRHVAFIARPEWEFLTCTRTRCVGSITPLGTRGPERRELVEFLLWLIAVILVIAGIVALVRGAIAYGLVLIIVGLLVGPGGVSLFT